jgi:hypothetical protein
MCTLVVGIGRLYSNVSSGPIKGGKYFDHSVDSQFLKDSVFKNLVYLTDKFISNSL